MSTQTRGILLALLAYGIYAGHDAVIKALGAQYSAVQIVFFSVLFSFPLTSLMAMGEAAPGTLRPRHPWWMALRMGAIVIASASAFYAFGVLPLADTYAILFAMPILITLLAVPILGERVRIRRGIAIVVGLAGVVVVLRPGQADLTLGHAAALLAAVCSALAATIVRRIGREERNVVMLLYPAAATFAVMGVCLPFTYRPMAGADLALNALIALLAFVAMLFSIEAYKRAEAALVAPMQYSQILWAIFYGWLLFDEWPDRTTAIGVALVISSGLYIVFREARGVSRTTPVLRTRSRAGTPAAPRVSTVQRLFGAGK